MTGGSPNKRLEKTDASPRYAGEPWLLSLSVRQTRKGTEIVSRYETLRAELGRLRIRQAIAVFAPAAATALLLIPATQPGGARLLVALGGLTVLPLVLHRVWRFTFPTYRAWSDRAFCTFARRLPKKKKKKKKN